MNKQTETTAVSSPTGTGRGLGGPGGLGLNRGFVLATIALVLCFTLPLSDLVRFAFRSDLYSHILLIPFISLYLIWMGKQSLPAPSAPARLLAVPFGMAGLGLLVLYWVADSSPSRLSHEDQLALTTLSFLLFFMGICCVFLGQSTLRAIAFPLGFLVFLAPFPTFLMDGIVSFLQYTSAATANAMFKLVGTPVFQNGMEFRLPGMSLEVAPECSGIHSTLVLFITSLVAGHLFLRSPAKRTVLTLAVIPLAILRNGFRILTIGELCVHVGPHMINSYIHRRGGPIFFALSLIPFLLLLYFLRRYRGSEKSATGSPPLP